MTETRHFEAVARIKNTPEAVMDYVSDVRNRPFFVSPLKSIEMVSGDPTGEDAVWRWQWSTLGMMFEGAAHCTRKEPGRLYAFETEGGLKSSWTYTAEADGDETELKVRVEYDVPERAAGKLPTEDILAKLRRAEIDSATENLKIILE